MDIKTRNLNDLLQNIKQLEARVSGVKQDTALSFSFFKDAFQTSQEIMRLLHELEMQQIEGMKAQMEKLVMFLSESESDKQEEQIEPTVSQDISETEIPEKEILHETDSETEDFTDTDIVQPEKSEGEIVKRNVYAEHVVLPAYANPRANPVADVQQEKAIKENEPKSDPVADRPVNLSVNDVLHASPAKIEVKRSLSLNDRFYYQRELFDNNRDAMNAAMEKINSFATIDEIKNYLESSTSWDFENETVKSFLELLDKSHS